MDQWLSEPNVMYTLLIVLAVEFVLGLLVVVGYLNLRRKRKTNTSDLFARVNPDEAPRLQELMDQARHDNLADPVNVVLGEGAYELDDVLNIETPIKLFGKGVLETKIASKGQQPALRIKDAKQCSVSNIRIEGAIQCFNSELLLENCHVVAKEDGICIEADQGAVVTFSGVMRGDGGIAIRAKGESKVILKPPYAVSGEDYIVKDPRSQVHVLQNESDMNTKDSSQ
ncbi:MAG: hypothetical protein GC154_00555 [bacterium]|nr:hypothetical protein [bacterium]